MAPIDVMVLGFIDTDLNFLFKKKWGSVSMLDEIKILANLEECKSTNTQ